MRALVLQLSAAAAAAVLFFQLFGGASLEHALVAAAVVGGATTFTLTAVGAVARRARRAPHPSPARPRADS
jgi:hypothetical protein